MGHMNLFWRKAVVCVALLSGTALADGQPVRPAYAVAIPAIAYLDTMAGRRLLHQCSRDAPVGVTSLWQVTPQDILGLDTLLAAEVGRQLVKKVAPRSPMGPRLSRDTTKYFVQVIGIRRGDLKRVYVNGFVLDTLQSFGNILHWRSQAGIVCDGGFGFFGVEFDATRRSLVRFFFNGFA